MPPLKNINCKPSTTKLYAANGTIINTFGERLLTLDLGLRRSFQWKFIIADVRQHIIGSDFLSHFDLLVDSKRKALLDRLTLIQTIGTLATCDHIRITTYNLSDRIATILKEYKDITQSRK